MPPELQSTDDPRLIRSVRLLLAETGFANALGSSLSGIFLTGMILSVLPIALGVIFTLIAPSYMLTFFRDPAGQAMLMACLVMQIVGYLWIRRVINIKV